jgi:hypothetical protein
MRVFPLAALAVVIVSLSYFVPKLAYFINSTGSADANLESVRSMGNSMLVSLGGGFVLIVHLILVLDTYTSKLSVAEVNVLYGRRAFARSIEEMISVLVGLTMVLCCIPLCLWVGAMVGDAYLSHYASSLLESKSYQRLLTSDTGAAKFIVDRFQVFKFSLQVDRSFWSLMWQLTQEWPIIILSLFLFYSLPTWLLRAPLEALARRRPS